jgi:predicted nucleotidyltransferase
MKQRDREIAIQLKKRLSENVPLLDFRVFGSRGRGDSDEYSDMDVFVLVEAIDKDTKEKIRDIVWEVGFENFVVISALVFTKDEIENTPLRSSQIVRNITEDGVRI